MDNVKRQELCPTLSRVSPVIIYIIIMLKCIILQSTSSIYLFICFFLIIGSNWMFKNAIAKPLYKLLNKLTLPILGSGERPKGAHSCAFTLDNKISISYGMPSCHSQIAWTVATYIICKIINNLYNNQNTNETNNNNIIIYNYIWLLLSCIIVLCLAIYISYSRVYIEGCHTIQQVIVGGLIGIGCGFIIYYFENDAIKLLSNLSKAQVYKSTSL